MDLYTAFWFAIVTSTLLLGSFGIFVRGLLRSGTPHATAAEERPASGTFVTGSLRRSTPRPK